MTRPVGALYWRVARISTPRRVSRVAVAGPVFRRCSYVLVDRA